MHSIVVERLARMTWVCIAAACLTACLAATPAWAETQLTSDGWQYDTASPTVYEAYKGEELSPKVPAGATVAVVNQGAGAVKVTSIDVSAAASTLTGLKVYGCALTALDVSACSALTDLWVQSNQLATLKLPAGVKRVHCSGNQLRSMDLSSCSKLSVLDCSDNKIVALDVSGCSALSSLDCSDNLLTELKVGANTRLYDLACCNNYIQEDLKTLTDRFGSEEGVILPQLKGEPQVDTVVAVPSGKAGLVYTGKVQAGVASGEGYSVTDGASSQVGTHYAICSLASGYQWADGTRGDKLVKWSIAKAPQAIAATGVKLSKSSVKASKFKKKGKALATVARKAVAKTAVTYSFKVVSGGKYVKVTSSGKLVTKKALKKKLTIKVKVTMTAAGNGNYSAAKSDSKTLTLKVK